MAIKDMDIKDMAIKDMATKDIMDIKDIIKNYFFKISLYVNL